MSGATLAGHSNSYHTFTFEQSLAGIAAAGFDSVELTAVPGWADFVSVNDDVADVRGTVAAHGLAATAVSTHLDVTAEGGADEASALVDWAGAYGLTVVNIAIGTVEDPAASRRDAVDVLRQIGAVAGGRGVTVAVEVHGNLASSGRSALGLVEAVGIDCVGLNYDTGNTEFYSGTRAEAELRDVIHRVHHFHLKDKLGGEGVWAFPALGGGHVPFGDVLEIVEREGRPIPMSVELEFLGEPWPVLEVVDDAMAVSLSHLRRLGFE